MIVAVTGATGHVGRFIVAKLLAEGAGVRAWRRPSSDLRGLPDGIQWIDGELGAPAAEAALVDGAAMLVHAALDHAPSLYRGGEGNDPAGHLRVNVGGGLALLAAARRASVSRCVVLSSRAVFGRDASDLVGDDDPPCPDTLYGASKAALEAFVRAWGHEGWPVAALRPTGVYGLANPPSRSKWFDLVQAALRGEAVPARCGSEVNGRDVADAVWRLLNAAPKEIAGRSFNCSDVLVSHRDIVEIVHRRAGISGPLPEAGMPPRSRMRCDGLEKLGLRFGGRALFTRTVEELTAAALAEAQPPSSSRAALSSSGPGIR